MSFSPLQCVLWLGFVSDFIVNIAPGEKNGLNMRIFSEGVRNNSIFPEEKMEINVKSGRNVGKRIALNESV